MSRGRFVHPGSLRDVASFLSDVRRYLLTGGRRRL